MSELAVSRADAASSVARFTPPNIVRRQLSTRNIAARSKFVSAQHQIVPAAGSRVTLSSSASSGVLALERLPRLPAGDGIDRSVRRRCRH